MEFINSTHSQIGFLELIRANENDDVDNDYYKLPADTHLYRGDNNETPGHLSKIKPRFFAYTKDAANTYGEILFKFAVKNDLLLLAVDKNIDNFYKEAPENIKMILENNYGYIPNDANNTRVRVSDYGKDNELLNYICNNTKFDGYATDLMDKPRIEGGSFHHEITICDYSNISEMVENISDKTTRMNQSIIQEGVKARMISEIDREKREEKKMQKRQDREHKEITEFKGMNLFGDSDSEDEEEPSEGGKRRALKKRKSTTKSAKKKKAKTMRKKKVYKKKQTKTRKKQAHKTRRIGRKH